MSIKGDAAGDLKTSARVENLARLDSFMNLEHHE